MVEKLKEILATIKRDKGNVSLFAILKMDELTDRWTVLLCADWATTNKAQAFEYLIGLLRGSLSQEDLQSVARVGVLGKDEHLIQDLLKYKANTVINDTIKINGNMVHEAHIFESEAS